MSNDKGANNCTLRGLMADPFVPECLNSVSYWQNKQKTRIISDFINKKDFDFNKLKLEFSKHCKDYLDPIKKGVGSFKIQFCSEIIYTKPSESSTNSKDSISKYIFKDTSNIDHKVFVTNINDNKYSLDSLGVKDPENCMILTSEQARLIALETFMQLLEFNYIESLKPTSFMKNKLLFTPVAKYYFAGADVDLLAKELQEPTNYIIKAINSSVESNGFYLQTADVNFAIYCVLQAIEDIKGQDMRRFIMCKIVTPYLDRNFIIKKERVQIIAKIMKNDAYSKYIDEALDELCDPLCDHKHKTYSQSEIDEACAYKRFSFK
ncbi:uncharacterized protein [Prorops nasuta]|uniref:uncharacterized protein n=1 Tax=Prorops nasuta TaxID=863751 RepID=UPI0034CE427F